MPNLNLGNAFAGGMAISQNALQQQRLEQQMELQRLAAGYTANRDLREAEKLQTEQTAKQFEIASKKYDYLIDMAPRLNASNYPAWRKQVEETFPMAAATLPPEFDPSLPKLIALQGADMKPQIIQQTIGGMTRSMRVGPTGAAEEVPGSRMSSDEYEPIKGPNETIVGYRPKYGRGKVLSPEEYEGGGGYMDYMMGREGTGKNPNSSAQGPGQFIDSTFVDTFRKTFPDRAATMSRSEILAQRGKTVDGVPVEEPMLRTFTAANQEKLRDAGFKPTKGNTYLAHFLGADGAVDILGASPDTPVTELLPPKAIKANPEVFSKVRTAGDLIRWAGGGGGDALTPTKMEPIGTARRQEQTGALNILKDLEIDESGMDRVSKLINDSTSGSIEAMGAAIPRAFGKATPGSKAIAQLQTIANTYTMEKLGKLGGGISNEDREFIIKTMGDIANASVPAEERLAAWGEVKRRLAKAANVDMAAATGTTRGKAGESAAPTKPANLRAPEVGAEEDGYVFLGGDPGNPANWKKR